MSSSSSQTETEEEADIHHSSSKIQEKHMTNIQFIANTIIYSFNMIYVQDLTHHDKDGPSFIQLVVSTLLIGMPLQFMQMVIGQYTQNSGINMRNMCPLGKGIGWGFMVDSFVQFLTLTLLTGDILLYTFHACQSVMPWTTCKGFNSSVCWDGKPCDGPCLTSTRNLAASTYYSFVFSQVESWWGIRRVATMFTIMVIVYATMSMFRNISNRVIITIYFGAFGWLGVTCVLLLNLNSNNLGYVFVEHIINIDQLLNYEAWFEAMCYAILILSIGKGGFILIGSHFESSRETGIVAVCSSVLMLIFVGIIYLMIISAQTFLLSITNSTQTVTINNNYFYLIPALTTIPETLSYLSFPQVFTVTFFASCLMCHIITIVINLRIIEISLANSFISFYRYRKYFLFMFMVLSVGFNLFLIVKEVALYSGSHFLHLFIAYDSLVVCTFSMVVSWVYGVQRLSDDIHFMTTSEPTIFWKAVWYAMPVLVACMLFKQMKDIFMLKYSNVSFFIVMLFYSPYVLMVIVKIFTLMKKNNLIGLFRPDPKWGPRSVEERLLRQIFNPRMETKSRRRNDLCTHNCLLNNKFLKVIVDREMDRSSEHTHSTSTSS